jgi:hypothetical protein
MRIIQYLPIHLVKLAQARFEYLLERCIQMWPNLERILIGNFQGTCKCPKNLSNLKGGKKWSDDTLRGYIRRFSKRCNELSGISNSDIVSSFIYSATNTALVYKLGCNRPRTINKLMAIVSDHTSGEDAVKRAIIHSSYLSIVTCFCLSSEFIISPTTLYISSLQQHPLCPSSISF